MVKETLKGFYSSTTSNLVLHRIKSAILRACSEFAAIDNRAFETATGDGFKTMLQEVFDAAGALHTASLSVEALTSHPARVKNLKTDTISPNVQ